MESFYSSIPVFEEVHHSLEVVDAVFSLHVHQDAVRGRLHGHMKEGIDAGMVEDLSHLLVQQREGTQRHQEN